MNLWLTCQKSLHACDANTYSSFWSHLDVLELAITLKLHRVPIDYCFFPLQSATHGKPRRILMVAVPYQSLLIQSYVEIQCSCFYSGGF